VELITRWQGISGDTLGGEKGGRGEEREEADRNGGNRRWLVWGRKEEARRKEMGLTRREWVPATCAADWRMVSWVSFAGGS
jgi:hypothetical protein